MSNYEKQNFVSGQILKAEHLNHMEDGIGQLSEGIVFNPTKWGLPVLALTGDISAMTKENAVDLAYEYEGRSGMASVKWQGSSSLS